MKKIITLIAIFVLVFINTILSADFWEKLQTPEGGVISRLLIDDSGNIYASWGRNRISTVNYTCRGEIYKSTDQGDNWFILDSNSNHGTIYDLTLLKNEVYIVTVDNNLFHYNSLLNKWIYIQNTSGGFEIRSYENSLYINNGYKIISVKNPNTDSSKTEINYDSHSNSASDFIYHFDINVKGNISVICSNYIMKSIDNGKNWKKYITNLSFDMIYSTKIREGNDGEIYIILQGGELYGKSESDTTFRWIDGNFGIYGITDIASLSDSILIVQSENGIKRSSNNGKNWAKVISTFNKPVNQFLYDSINKILFSGTNEGVYASRDNGISFQFKNSGICDNNLSKIIIDNKNNLYTLAPQSKIFKSSDGGNIWYDISQTMISHDILSIYVNKLGTIFSGTRSGFYYSLDNGISWNRNDSIMTNDPIILNGEYDNTLFSIGQNYLYRSKDYGINWENLSLKNNLLTNIKSINVKNNEVLITNDSCLFRSIDNGDSFFLVSTFHFSFPHQGISNSMIDNKICYINFDGQYIIRLDDNYQIRDTLVNSQILNGVNTISNFIVKGDTIYFSSPNKGIFFTGNLGKTWFKLNDGLGKKNDSLANISDIIFGPDAYLYCIDNYEVYKSKLPAPVVDRIICLNKDIFGYPNPTKSIISITIPPKYQSSQIKIYSVEGIQVFESEYKDKIDVSSFAPGVYYIKVGDRVCRFVKI